MENQFYSDRLEDMPDPTGDFSIESFLKTVDTNLASNPNLKKEKAPPKPKLKRQKAKPKRKAQSKPVPPRPRPEDKYQFGKKYERHLDRTLAYRFAKPEPEPGPDFAYTPKVPQVDQDYTSVGQFYTTKPEAEGGPDVVPYVEHQLPKKQQFTAPDLFYTTKLPMVDDDGSTVTYGGEFKTLY